MAQTTTKTSEYIEVIVADAYDDEKSFNLDYPRTDVTLATVTTAFNILIDANDSDCTVFCDKTGEPYTQVKRASLIQTVKRTTPLE